MTEVINHTFYSIRGELDRVEAYVRETIGEKMILFGKDFGACFDTVPVEDLLPEERRALLNLEDPEAAELDVLAKKKNRTVEENQRLYDAGYRREVLGAVIGATSKLAQADFS